MLACGGAARPADVTTTTMTYAAPAEQTAATGNAKPPPAPLSSLLLTVRSASAPSRASLWRVFSDGRAVRLAYDFPAVRRESIEGTTAPVASRDGRRVAFVKDASLWLLDTSSLAARAVGRAAPFGQDLLVDAFTPDGADVLVHVGPKYELVSAATGTTTDGPGGGEVAGFFPDGAIALLSPDGRALSHVVVGGAPAVVHRSPTAMLQVALSPDGKAAAYGTNVGDVDRVVRADLATGAATTLADAAAGRAVQNPWPSFSPSSKVAWLEEPPMVKNEDAVRVAIEGGAAVELGGARISRFHWIDDATLALESEGRLVVVDVATGAIKGRTDVR